MSSTQPAPMNTFAIPVQQPFDWESLLAFLRLRATPGVETVTDSAYTRTYPMVAPRAHVFRDVRLPGSGFASCIFRRGHRAKPNGEPRKTDIQARCEHRADRSFPLSRPVAQRLCETTGRVASARRMVSFGNRHARYFGPAGFRPRCNNADGTSGACCWNTVE